MTTNPKLVKYDILQGPGELDFMLGLFRNQKFQLTLHPESRAIEGGITTETDLQRVDAVVGKNHVFKFHGFVTFKFHGRPATTVKTGKLFEGSCNSGKFVGIYDIKSRKGFIFINRTGGPDDVEVDEDALKV